MLRPAGVTVLAVVNWIWVIWHLLQPQVRAVLAAR